MRFPHSFKPFMNAPAQDAPPKDFESALVELEALVERMETGELSLEESLFAYRRGIELARYCEKTLHEAEQQVRMLEENMLKPWPEESGDD